MPSVPIEMPSLTPMVLNRMPTRPAAATPSLTWAASSFEVHVAGVALVPHAGDADLRLLHVGFGQAGAIEHGLRGPLAFGLRDAGTEFVEHRRDRSQGSGIRSQTKNCRRQIPCAGTGGTTIGANHTTNFVINSKRAS